MKKILFILCLAVSFSLSSQNINSSVNLDVAWTDWSASINPQGFSSTSTVYSRYVKIGKKCTVMFYISGTSNSTSFTCTLPFAAANNSGQNEIIPVSIQDNGVAGMSNAYTTANSTTFTFNKTAFVGTFTASGTKTGIGVITYETN